MVDNIAIAWIKLSVRPNVKSNDKSILNEISGSFEKNSINALMGASGSGKSTLLKCLNGSGKYRLSEESKLFIRSDQKIIRTFIYQDQEERIMTGLTVEQSLSYSSKLKNSGLGIVDHKKVVSDVMNALLISDIKDNRIENCSGGQIKRICIGLELTSICKPNLLFIDEPTTGLDSNAAEIVIECLKQLTCEYKMTTIVSIHQPNNDLFHMFNNIYVLAKGGVCVFSGPPMALKNHLIDSNIELSEKQVPIEVLIKISFGGIQSKKVQQLSDKTNEIINKSLIFTNRLKPINNGLKKMSKSFAILDFWYILLRFLHRNYVSNFKMIAQQYISYIIMIVMSYKVITTVNITENDGCFQLNTISNKSCLSIKESDSSLSYNTVFTSTMILFSSIIQLITFVISYSNDMKIFTSEHKNQWYSSGSYFCAKNIVESLMVIIFTALTVITMQIMTNQFNDQVKLLNISLVILVTFMINRCVGAIIGILWSNDFNFGIFIAMINFIIAVLFNDVLLKLDKSNFLVDLLTKLDYLQYNFKSMMIIIYGFGRCPNGYDSKVLIEYDLVDENTIYTQYLRRLFVFVIVLTSIELIVILIRVKIIRFYISKFKTNGSVNESDNNNIDLESNLDNINNNYLDQFEEESMDTNTEVMIYWKDLSYSVKKSLIKSDYIQLLDNINGYFQTNTLNAVMGPSGAGKTTFLKCLNGRTSNGLSDESRILINSTKSVKSCFIVQNISEHLLKGLTVRQTLLYASKLKNSNMKINLNHNKNVEDLMSRLLISEISENNVEKCSGGERKRIAIASELTSYIKPNLLCIDEPTSGLDSNAAERIISLLKSISLKYSMTTIVSIHQPNNDLFEMFHKIYVLAKGGLCVYSGTPINLRQHLTDCDIDCNKRIPIEVLLKIASNEKDCEIIKRMVIITKIDSKLKGCDQKFKEFNPNERQTKRFTAIDFYYLLMRTMRYKYLSQWKSLLMLFLIYLSFSSLLRFLANPEMIEPNGCLDIDFSFGCNQTLQSLRDDYHLKDSLRYNFYFITFLAIIVVIIISVSFGEDFKILRNESKNGWYSVGAYFWSKSLTDFLPDLISMAICCWIITFYDDWRTNIIYYFVSIMVTLCSQSIAQISAIIFSSNSKMSMTLAIIIVLHLDMLANIMIPMRKVHYSLQLLSQFSYFRHGFELIMISIYGFDRCFGNEISLVLYEFGIKSEIFWSNLFNLIFLCIGLKLFSLILLIFKIKSVVKFEKIESIDEKELQIKTEEIVF